MAFTDDVTEVIDPIRDAIAAYSMVERLEAGTLDEEPFRYWLEQDHRFLESYCRAFANGAAERRRPAFRGAVEVEVGFSDVAYGAAAGRDGDGTGDV